MQRGIFLHLLPLCALSGCAADLPPAGEGPGDALPIAIVDGEQTVEPSSWVRLDGSASHDPHGRDLSYYWSQTSGPYVELESWRTPVSSFVAPANASAQPLIFKLEIDNGAASAEANTQVRVIQGEPPPPQDGLHADAGPDQGVLSGERVTLDGSTSTGDPEKELAFAWTQLSGLAVELDNADQPEASFTAPDIEEGLETLTFQLEITQGEASDSDTVAIVVVANGEPPPGDGGDGCAESSECNDDDPCTMDDCIEGFCQHRVDPECGDSNDCEFNWECDDADECTVDTCDVEGFCRHEIIPHCGPDECQEHADCDNGDNCTIDSCTDGECQNDPIDCADGDDCTEDTCAPDGSCLHEPIADCGGPEPLPLFTTQGDSERVLERYPEWGMQRIYCVGPDTDFDNHFTESDRERMEYSINRLMPDENYDGYLCLDWEEEAIVVMNEGAGHPDHARLLGEFIEALQFAKSLRPRAKVGYYMIPTREYWNQDERWYQAMDDLRPLLEAEDVLFPSVYDFYHCEFQNNEGCVRDLERFGEIVRLSLELSGGKPVMPFSFHRYHPGVEGYGYELIPLDEYQAHIHHLARTIEHNGDHVDGMVHFGATVWYYNQAFEIDEEGRYIRNTERYDIRMRRIFTEEMDNAGIHDIQEYAEWLHPQLYDMLFEAVNGME